MPGLFAGTSLTGFWDSPHALSTAFGILAGGIWLVCSVPQLLKTFKTQSAKDISPQFAALRVTGDLGMVIGLNLIDAQLSQVALAWYFLLTNLVMLLQWWYAPTLDRMVAQGHLRQATKEGHLHTQYPRSHLPSS